MTPQDAIKWANAKMLEITYEFDSAQSKAWRDRLNKEYQALTVLKSCAESKIPLKVIEEKRSFFPVCPACNKFVKKHEQSHGKIVIPHCKWCGQALYWSDSE